MDASAGFDYGNAISTRDELRKIPPPPLFLYTQMAGWALLIFMLLVKASGGED